jgi:NifU-like protein involved in Fe-S cluster formation
MEKIKATDALAEFNQLLREEMKKAYSEKAIDYINNPRNLGPLDNASGYAAVTDEHGDELHLWLDITEERIKKASFFTRGCVTIKIAGSALTEMVGGKTLDEAMTISPKELRDYIGRTPRKTWHCTNLAVAVLREAIKNYVFRWVFGNQNQEIVRIDL